MSGSLYISRTYGYLNIDRLNDRDPPPHTLNIPTAVQLHGIQLTLPDRADCR